MRVDSEQPDSDDEDSSELVQPHLREEVREQQEGGYAAWKRDRASPVDYMPRKPD